MDDPDKSTLLLPAPPNSNELRLQFPEEVLVADALSARRALACRVVAAGFGLLFIVLFCFKAVTESADQRRSFSSSCMHALGGGPVGPRGSLLHFDPRCTEELKVRPTNLRAFESPFLMGDVHLSSATLSFCLPSAFRSAAFARVPPDLQEYFDHAYYSEVRRVSDQAIAYFKQQVARHQQQETLGGVAPGSSLGTVIFDIGEPRNLSSPLLSRRPFRSASQSLAASTPSYPDPTSQPAYLVRTASSTPRHLPPNLRAPPPRTPP
jgi:hypothetical protein